MNCQVCGKGEATLHKVSDAIILHLCAKCVKSHKAVKVVPVSDKCDGCACLGVCCRT